MREKEKDENSKESKKEKNENRIDRRDVLKSLATLPVLGGFIYGAIAKKSRDNFKKRLILSELGLEEGAPSVLPKTTFKKQGELIRIGIIGFGGRGESLIRSAGFVHPTYWSDRKKFALEQEKIDRLYIRNLEKEIKAYFNQESLNIVLTGVCDLFDVRAERGIAASKNENSPAAKTGKLSGAKRYYHYQDLLQSKDIDAVIIATPDHWHSRIVVDAANAGKHVYCEKCMTRTEEEVYRVFNAVKKSGIVFQLGHQNRQQESHFKAKKIVEKNILGKVTLIETTTNRNTPGGAWVYAIHKDGNPKTIDWEQFQLPAPHKVPFSPERFFRWRCWYDYGTGLSGDLLSHEFDAINQIMNLGIPKSAVASGGIYFYKDGRDVPDVFQVVFEYPDRDLTLVYSATLANGKYRGKVFMGHDATMEVGSSLTVMADENSTRYRKKIKDEIIDTSLPIFSYAPGSKKIDAVTSATEKYFATRGLMYTYREGRLVDVTHLHIKEWLDCIRNGKQPSCNIDRGFEEAITCHMATKSYLEGRKVFWDSRKKRIV